MIRLRDRPTSKRNNSTSGLVQNEARSRHVFTLLAKMNLANVLQHQGDLAASIALRDRRWQAYNWPLCTHSLQSTQERTQRSRHPDRDTGNGEDEGGAWKRWQAYNWPLCEHRSRRVGKLISGPCVITGIEAMASL